MKKGQLPATDICILIPCYNNSKGLTESINSIVYYPDNHLIVVVDDGSKDPVIPDDLYKHLRTTVNIKIIRLIKNMGIAVALNEGLSFIYNNYNARFIARLDCGDLCYPGRFFRQVSFLESHPAVDLLGAWCYFKDTLTGAGYKFITPTQHKHIKRSMYFRNVFVHPTVIWRVSALNVLRYPEKYPHAEDYGLFYDMVRNNKTAIMDEFLVTCEINKAGISYQNRHKQLKSRLKVVWHFGENKILVVAGVIKLLTLMLIPHKIVNRVKKQLYKIKPG